MKVEKRVQEELKNYNYLKDYTTNDAFTLIKHVLFRYEWRNELVKEVCNIMITRRLSGATDKEEA